MSYKLNVNSNQRSIQLKERKERKDTLNGYGQMYRSGITMKEHWATEKRIEQDRKQMEKDRLGKSLK